MKHEQRQLKKKVAHANAELNRLLDTIPRDMPRIQQLTLKIRQLNTRLAELSNPNDRPIEFWQLNPNLRQIDAKYDSMVKGRLTR